MFDRPEKNGIHVWVSSFAMHESKWPDLWKLLSQEERDRAERFRFGRDRTRYVTGRGILRLLLGGYTGIPPERLLFRYGTNGKPALAETSGGEQIRFNLSHSGDWLVLAVASGRDVGVDVEPVRDFPEADLIVEQFFTPQETGRYFRMKKEKGEAAFFICWTRREAYVKATGEGLAGSVDEASVRFADEEEDLSSGSAERRWTVTDLPVAEDVAAALCAEGWGWIPVIRCFRWDGMKIHGE